jgi:hypothetical protein
MDIVGATLGGNGVRDRHDLRLFNEGVPTAETSRQTATRQAIGGENDGISRQLARYIVETGDNDATDMNVALRFRRDRFLRSSDHVSFLAHQIRRLRVPVPRGPHGRLHGRGAGPLARAAYERAGDLGDPDLRHRAALEHQPGAGRRRL